VDEAVTLLQSYNIDTTGGPPVHYLVADPSGRAALVEFYQGKMVIFTNEKPWHLATNFLRASVSGSPAGQCWRYDKIDQQMTATQGRLTAHGAADLLASVSQLVTQWSVVYHMGTGEITVTMGRQYARSPHVFHLALK
jgi:choloylglycine hydrolase